MAATLVAFAILALMPLCAKTMNKISLDSSKAVVGGEALLSCDVTRPRDDDLFLILWFNEYLTTPVYSYDGRPGSPDTSTGSHWLDSTVLADRAGLILSDTEARLSISPVKESDRGLYRCRVDFRKQATKTTRVKLDVIVPPHALKISEGARQDIQGALGPYTIGAITTVTCTAVGGDPPPKIVWFYNDQLLDDQMDAIIDQENESPFNISDNSEEHQPGTSGTKMTPTSSSSSILYPTHYNKQSRTNKSPIRIMGSKDTRFRRTITDQLVPDLESKRRGMANTSAALRNSTYRNTVRLGPFSREDLKSIVRCAATNSNMTAPLSSSFVIDMNLPPLHISVDSPKPPFSAGRGAITFTCSVFGSRPPPTITWMKGGVRVMPQTDKTTSSDSNKTSSVLKLHPLPSDDGSSLTCRAANTATNTVLEYPTLLTVYYVPEVEISLGSNLTPSSIKEGDDVYFECTISANPRAYKITWLHEGRRILEHNPSEGVILGDKSLALQSVTRMTRGNYSCQASNIEGDGISKPLTLDVKYAPVCGIKTPNNFGVARGENAEVYCSVSSNPVSTRFTWSFNNSADTVHVPEGSYTVLENNTSIITYTPVTVLDYGTLLCYAENELGRQTHPCVLQIVAAGPPDPPSPCDVINQTSSTLYVTCTPGFDGGLRQHFVLSWERDASNAEDSRDRGNVTSDQPVFELVGLQASTMYQLVIVAVNERGNSEPINKSGFTLNGPGLRNHRQGPSEAEVRDSLDNSSDGAKGGARRSSNDISNYAAIIGGVVALFLVVSLVLSAVIVRIWLQRRRREASDDSWKSGGSCDNVSTELCDQRDCQVNDDSTNSSVLVLSASQIATSLSVTSGQSGINTITSIGVRPDSSLSRSYITTTSPIVSSLSRTEAHSNSPRYRGDHPLSVTCSPQSFSPSPPPFPLPQMSAYPQDNRDLIAMQHKHVKQHPPAINHSLTGSLRLKVTNQISGGNKYDSGHFTVPDGTGGICLPPPLYNNTTGGRGSIGSGWNDGFQGSRGGALASQCSSQQSGSGVNQNLNLHHLRRNIAADCQIEVRSDGEESTAPTKTLPNYASFDPRRNFRRHQEMAGETGRDGHSHQHHHKQQQHFTHHVHHHSHHSHQGLRHAKSQAELHSSQCALLEWYNKHHQNAQTNAVTNKAPLQRKKSVHFDDSAPCRDDRKQLEFADRKAIRFNKGMSLEDISKPTMLPYSPLDNKS